MPHAPHSMLHAVRAHFNRGTSSSIRATHHPPLTNVLLEMQVNFNLVGVMFMIGASASDSLRLVIAQKLLSSLKV